MTVQSRGARSRRGGRFNSSRGPGWLLLTALLLLAIVASSTLVFSSRVELLRLAVILSLWAAVLAAFVTVVYRRQTDVAQARARDMKFVYDLQLEREISARREYELSVETQLRRQMSQEARAQAADEVAALRAELASLRSHLEVMLGTDLAPRPALESDRVAAVVMPPAPGRVESSRVTVVTEEFVAEEVMTEEYAAESPIIDVTEEPLTPAAPEYPQAPAPVAQPQPNVPPPYVEQYAPPVAPQPDVPWRPPEVRLGRHSTGDRAQYPPRPEPPRPEPPRPEPPRPEPPRPEPTPPPPPAPPRGRHWVPAEGQPIPPGRHRGALEPVTEQPVEQASQEEPVEPQGQHADGQSFADLMQRLQVNRPAGGGGRRRRDD